MIIELTRGIVEENGVKYLLSEFYILGQRYTKKVQYFEGIDELMLDRARITAKKELTFEFLNKNKDNKSGKYLMVAPIVAVKKARKND